MIHHPSLLVQRENLSTDRRARSDNPRSTSLGKLNNLLKVLCFLCNHRNILLLFFQVIYLIP